MKCFSHFCSRNQRGKKIPCIKRGFGQRLDLKLLLYILAIILWFYSYYHGEMLFWSFGFFFFCFFFLFFFFWLPCSIWSSQARDQIRVVVPPKPQLWQHQIRNPLCRSRDQTCAPALPRHRQSHGATVGTP